MLPRSTNVAERARVRLGEPAFKLLADLGRVP